MPTITPQDGGLTAGIAGKSSDTINPPAEELFTGDAPAVFTTEHTVANGENLAALSVVGFDSNGELVMAVQEDEASPIKPIGVLVYAVDATGGAAKGHVYRSGCLNPDLLVWDASYDTDAEKAAAFEGSPSPTQIITRKIATLAV